MILWPGDKVKASLSTTFYDSLVDIVTVIRNHFVPHAHTIIILVQLWHRLDVSAYHVVEILKGNGQGPILAYGPQPAVRFGNTST